MRTGENIYKRKDGRWEARVPIGHSTTGRLQYKFLYAPTYREVKKKKQLFVEQKTIIVPPAPAEDLYTVSAIARLWLANNEPIWRPATYNKYENSLKKYILPKWQNTVITQITQSDYEEWIDELSKKGHPSAVSTVNLVLRSIQRYLLTYKMQSTQFTVIDAQSPLTVCRKTDPLNDTEWSLLSDYALDTPCPTTHGILICLYEGIRVGELCALRWKDIDISNQTIHIRETLHRLPDKTDPSRKHKTCLSFGPPKSGKERHIPIHPVLLPLLAQEKSYHDTDDFIVSGTVHIVEPRTFTNRFHRILKHCGIRKVNVHLLRHSFATRCVEAGIDIKALSEILGHKTVKITMDRYVHLSQQYKQKQLSLLTFHSDNNRQKKRQTG